MFVFVPNGLRDELNRRLNIALAEMPEAAGERDNLYQQAVAYFDEYGVVPDFHIVKQDSHPRQLENK